MVNKLNKENRDNILFRLSNPAVDTSSHIMTLYSLNNALIDLLVEKKIVTRKELKKFMSEHMDREAEEFNKFIKDNESALKDIYNKNKDEFVG